VLRAFAGAELRDGHRAIDEVLRFLPARTNDELLAELDRLYDAARESLGCVWPAVQSARAAFLHPNRWDSGVTENRFGERAKAVLH